MTDEEYEERMQDVLSKVQFKASRPELRAAIIDLIAHFERRKRHNTIDKAIAHEVLQVIERAWQ